MKHFLLIHLIIVISVGFTFGAACTTSPTTNLTSDASSVQMVTQAPLTQQTATATQEGGQTMALQVTSSAFANGADIPKKYSCDGQNVSPQLAWTGVPTGTKSLALITHDPDAPSGDFVHWVIYDMPASLSGLPEGVATTPIVQGTGTQGANGTGKTGYMGPCPPKGKPHHYKFQLYALDAVLGLQPGATKTDVEKAIQGHILSQGLLVGTYNR